MNNTRRRTLFSPIKQQTGELVYIENIGGGYIDTGFTPNSDSVNISLLFEHTGSNEIQGLMGARSDTTSQCLTVWLFNDNQVGAQYISNSYDSNPITHDYHQLTRYEFLGDGFYADINYHNFDNESYPTPNCSLTLFAVNTNGTADPRRAVGRLYACKIYDNEVLIRDYVPYIYKGKVGLYDKVNDTYTFSSADNFIAGPMKEEVAWTNIIKEQDGNTEFYQEVLSALNPGETINILADFTNDAILATANRIFGFTFKNTYRQSTAYILGTETLNTNPELFHYVRVIVAPIYTTFASISKGNTTGHHRTIISITRGKTAEENATLTFYWDGLAGTASTENVIEDSNFESGLKILNADEDLRNSLDFNGTYHDISIFKGTLTDLQKRTISFD